MTLLEKIQQLRSQIGDSLLIDILEDLLEATKECHHECEVSQDDLMTLQRDLEDQIEAAEDR